VGFLAASFPEASFSGWWLLSGIGLSEPPNERHLFRPVVVLNNPRLNGNNLTYDVRTLEGDLPTTGIMSTLFIDGGGGDWIKSSASCSEDGDWTRAGGAYRIVC